MSSKVKLYSKDVEWYADLPGKPSDGQLVAIEQASRRCLGSNINNGWSFGKPHIEPTETVGRYKLKLTIKKVNATRRFDPADAESAAMRIRDKLSIQLPGWKKIGDDSSNDINTTKEATTAELLAFPENIKEYFSHIYERDLHITEILGAIGLARDTDMRMREHVLLYGYPGCAKTELIQTIPEIFGEVAVKELDATALTKAGAERMLLESPQVPKIILLEELEKTIEGNLPWLLAVLDTRGKITKTNARMDVSRLTRCLVIATVNDVDKFKNFQSGALYDRFCHRLYCPLPSRELLQKILLREVVNIPGGDPAWIEPAIEYALEVENTYQVRRVLAIMALGRDRLITGEYQDEHQKLRRVKEEDEKQITKYVMGGD
jgi:SpoVK/Ycf46/Vps4 family AAA+-type ATPase